MYLTLGQAAKATGKSKATISKYIRNKKLGFVSKNSSGYQIDPAELFRVFPKNERKTVNPEQSQTSKETPVNTEINIRLELALKEIETLKADKEDLKKERDDWKDQAKRLLLNPPQKTTQGKRRLLWWRRTTKD